jgi:signal transduction histidine kinase
MPPDSEAGESRRGASTLALSLLPLGVPILMVALVMALHSDRVGRPSGIAPITSAMFTPLERSAVADLPGASTVQLPQEWSRDYADLVRGRYALAISLPEALPSELALYVPRINTRAAVRINGHLLTSAADIPGLASRYWLVPLYRSIPSALLVPSRNQVDLELTVDDEGTGFLGPVYLGDDARLRPAFELRRFLQVTGLQVLVIALLSVGAFLALLSLLRRKDTTYFWFGVVLWIFAFGFWNLLAIDSWIPKPPYRWVGAVTMAWLVAAIVVFVHRFFGERHPRAEAALAGVVAIGSLYFWVTLGTPLFPMMVPVWGGLVLAAGLYPGARVLTRFVAEPGLEMAWVVTAGVLIILVGAHDIALVNGAFGLGHDFAIQYAAGVSAVIFAFVFVTRFIEALDTSEALSAELAERVEEKAAEIERSHAQLRALENEQAVAQERERILGEIHDGMGGQLVSALAMVRHGEGDADEVAEAIQAALDDMRLMIHSLDDVEGDLGTLLGSLRARIGRRLEQSGLTLDWRISDTPQPRDFGPEAALQVMRIAQEAITNVIKHAEARRITIRTFTSEGAPGWVVVEVADDGRGFDAGAGDAGRGLSHMRMRAQRIGAELELRSSPDGTRVQLRLPAAQPRG